MARRYDTRSISVHRSYTVDEISRALGVCKTTVRRWIKGGGLHVIDDRKPALIHGPELERFLGERHTKTRKCRLDECFCFKCRASRSAAFGEAEILEGSGLALNIRMLCEACSGVMHKRVAKRDIPQLAALLRVSAPQALLHLIDTARPCGNVHLEREC